MMSETIIEYTVAHTTFLEGFPSKLTIIPHRNPFQGPQLQFMDWARRHGNVDLTLSVLAEIY